MLTKDERARAREELPGADEGTQADGWKWTQRWGARLLGALDAADRQQDAPRLQTRTAGAAMKNALTKERREALVQGCRDVLEFRRAMAAQEDAAELSLRILGGKVPTPTTEELLHLLEEQKATSQAALFSGITSVKTVINGVRVVIEDDGEGRFYAMRTDGVYRFLVDGKWHNQGRRCPEIGVYKTATEALGAVHASLAAEGAAHA